MVVGAVEYQCVRAVSGALSEEYSWAFARGSRCLYAMMLRVGQCGIDGAGAGARRGGRSGAGVMRGG